MDSEKNAIIEFDYDGALPSNLGDSLGNPASHPLLVVAVDIFGNAHLNIFHLSSAPPIIPNSPRVVEIHDDNARRAIEHALKKSTAGPATADDLANLTSLEHRNDKALTRLTLPDGLIHLCSLRLDGNELTLPDGITNLRQLWLAGNSLRDFTLPEGMINLRDLYLSREALKRLLLSEKLPNLKSLNLESLNFSRNSPSQLPDGLANMRSLSIKNSPLRGWTLPNGLSNLVWLYLWGNQMTELTLSEGMASLKVLNLEGSSITCLSTHRDVDVENLNLTGFPKKDVAFYGSPCH